VTRARSERARRRLRGAPAARAGRRPAPLACAAALALAAVAGTARAQVPSMDVSVVPEFASVQPGGALRVALRLGIPPGWHIYWINPGSAGLPTTLAWQLPAGVSGGATDWPYPETDESGGEVTNVYRGTVVAFSSFTAAPAASGRVKLTAHLVWGLCQAQCVRQERTVEVTVPVSSRAPQRTTAWSEAEAAARFLPLREPGAVLTAVARGDTVRLDLVGLRAGPEPGSWVTYFPLAPGLPSAVAQVRTAPGGIAVTLPRAVADSARLTGVLVPAHAPGAPPPGRAIAVDAALTR